MLNITKAELCEKLAVVKQVINSKAQIEATRGALIANGRIVGTDLTTFISTPIDTDESFILPFKAIQMIEQLPDGFISISCKDKKICIQSDTITSRFLTFNASDFPALPEISEIEPVAIETEFFKTAISNTIFLAKESTNNPVYGGVCIKHGTDGVDFVACDGIRLVNYTAGSLKNKIDCVVPKQAAAIAVSVCDDSENVLIGATAKHLILDVGDKRIITRVLGGQYLDFKKILNVKRKEIKLDAGLLRGCISRSVVVCSDIMAPVKLEIGNGYMNIEANTTDGTYNENITFENNDEENSIHIGVNSVKFLELLKKFGSGEITLEYTKPTEAIIVRKDSLKAMILPVKLRTEG